MQEQLCTLVHHSTLLLACKNMQGGRAKSCCAVLGHMCCAVLCSAVLCCATAVPKPYCGPSVVTT